MSRSRRLLASIAALIVIFIGVAWWALIENGSPARPIPDIPLAQMRAAVAADGAEVRPERFDLHLVARIMAPAYAVEAGGGLGTFPIAYTAFEARYAGGGGPVMIDAAGDRKTALGNTSPDKVSYDDAAWRRLLDRVVAARLVVLTHEHKDHVMALARHPKLAAIAPHAWLTKEQLPILSKSAETPQARAILTRATTQPGNGVTRIAPGIAVAPMPGHSPGSQLIYARLASGREYLFIGDIGWAMSNVAHVRTRPRILQWVFFDPPEQRSRVLAQLQALHDLALHEPQLVMVPCHDADYLMTLVKQGTLHDAAND